MSEYILIDNELYHADELMHYGVLGMKWGKRKSSYYEKKSERYTNKKK